MGAGSAVQGGACQAKIPNEPILEVQPEENETACAPQNEPTLPPTGDDGIDGDELAGVGGGSSRMSEAGDGFGAFAGDDEGFGVDAGFEGAEARRRLCLWGCWGQQIPGNSDGWR